MNFGRKMILATCVSESDAGKSIQALRGLGYHCWPEKVGRAYWHVVGYMRGS